jgi:hypothetical protein
MRKSLIVAALLFVSLLGAQWAKADTCNGVSPANNLVSNCAFGTGDFTSWSGTALTSFQDGIDTGDTPPALGTTPYDGLTYEAYLGDEGGTGTLEQTLTTVVGQQYIVEFALLNDTAPTTEYPNSFVAAFGGSTLLDEIQAPADAYTLYSYLVEASGTSTTLSFTDENNPGYFELDSISVDATATPEPGSLLLFGTGLLALAGVARRRLSRR